MSKSKAEKYLISFLILDHLKISLSVLLFELLQS